MLVALQNDMSPLVRTQPSMTTSDLTRNVRSAYLDRTKAVMHDRPAIVSLLVHDMLVHTVRSIS
jgi:hypothetical protein